MNRRQRSAASVSERAPLCAIEAMELYAAEIERGVRGSSQHGRLGDLWLKAACLMLSLSGSGPGGSDFMELQADEFGIGACGSKRYGWLGDLWLNAVCWMLVVGDTAQSGVPQGRVARQADRSGWRGPRTSQTDGATVWRLRGCFLSGEMQVRGCAARFHGYSSKCLQAAVAAGMKGVVQERVVRALQRTCANDDAAGYNGTVREARNFAMVRRVLVLENAYVHVYESACADALSRGELEGRWCLGATAGTYVSSLVWLRAERHVVRLAPNMHRVGWMVAGARVILWRLGFDTLSVRLRRRTDGGRTIWGHAVCLARGRLLLMSSALAQVYAMATVMGASRQQCRRLPRVL